MANVIEILLRGVDESAPAFASVRANVSKLAIGVSAAVASFLAFGAVKENLIEAEDASNKLNQAYQRLGGNAQLTKRQLTDLADELQHTTTVSDGLVKESEALLLGFTKVRGEAFERTIKIAADLADKFGSMQDATRAVGLALQDPIKGLRGLREAQITFTSAQQKTIQYLVETGQQAKVQEIILSSLEQRYKGTAAAARNTLGGAIQALKTQFGSLFEGTGDNSKLTGAINSLTAELSSPELKAGITQLVTGLVNIASFGVKAAAAVGNFAGKVSEAFRSHADDDPIELTTKRIKDLQKAIEEAENPRNARGTLTGDGDTDPTPRRTGRGGIAANAAAMKEDLARLQAQLAELQAQAEKSGAAVGGTVKDIIDDFTDPVQEITITVKKISEDIPSFLQQMNESTKTEVEKTATEFIRLKEELEALTNERVISPEEAAKRRAQALEDLLPEFDLNEIRAKYKPIKQATTELDEFTKGVWQGVGNSIRQSLSDALYDGTVSLKTFVNVVRRAFADILAAIITSGVKKAILAQFSGAGASSGSSSSSGWAAVGAGILSLFGGSAAGGRSSKPRIVGEEGPELLTDGGTVYNQRTLAAMGGAASVSFSPSFNYEVIEREDPSKAKREMAQYTETRIAQSISELVRVLRRSGVNVNA